MAENYIWGNLTRTVNDPTVIDQAIAEAVDAHNDNPDAHLEAGQALESHRASEIMDHRAESVVNDKLAYTTRRYNAIVNPDVDSDFDTLAEAITYCKANGGGTILLSPGTHYFSGDLFISPRISIEGLSADTTIIAPNNPTTDAIYFSDEPGEDYGQYTTQTVRHLTFGASGKPINFGYSESYQKLIFEEVIFFSLGSELYMPMSYDENSLVFNNCDFVFDSTSGKFGMFAATFTNCAFLRGGGSGSCFTAECVRFTRCSFTGNDGAVRTDFFKDNWNGHSLLNCVFYNVEVNIKENVNYEQDYLNIISACLFQMQTNKNVDITSKKTIFTNNKVRLYAAGRLRVVSGSKNVIMIGNVSNIALVNSGTTTQLIANVVS